MELNTVIRGRPGAYKWRVILCCEVLGEGVERTKHAARDAADTAKRSVSFTRGTVSIATTAVRCSFRPTRK